ncbi:glycerate kinase [Sporosarcina jiandibaonis]|uniref:glycerate kinase n=1 Tax=Sporosarcina jiandibaonis TaxID=2715535 RepID=UPI001556EA9F|nr:glycerate kinase [Sporosarcina jiandibaonis]
MNIVIAPDSFKGSLTSIQVINIMKKAIKNVNPNYIVIEKPMADGGEGTIESLLTATKGEKFPIKCLGPLGEEIHTIYAIVELNTTVIECASIAGLTQVPINKRNPDITTSFGIGEAIIKALDKGCTSFIIGLGGSATNDGGLGMLLALGMKAWDQYGKEIGPFGRDVHHISRISFSELDSRLAEVDIKIASDVDNPLCGEKGASAVYGPQKGATLAQVKKYDLALDHFGDLIEAAVHKSIKTIPGAGAAGGLGFALLAIGANITSGAELLADAVNMEDAIRNADLVITGEGQSDEQTLYGKAPGYIASLATKHNVPVVLISGSLKDVEKLSSSFAGCFSIINKPLSLESCMEHADSLLYEQTKQIVQLASVIRQK